ncbi:MAG: chitobiase/beta-hexosaminidase C-terminal domain-containing protein [Lachnospiraceae bacterium]|nr:chitobiase/beta-hexosaminidase C-terminal domain-containing protein [Lachnospiraceae bacterium]
MKCEICGTEIPEGTLYCPKCGKDVHIVPDFKEFAERKAEDTVRNLLNDLDGEEADFGRSPEGANDERPVRKKEGFTEEKQSKYGWTRFALLAASIMILASVSLGFINMSGRTDFLLESAREAAISGDSAQAKAILEGIEAKDAADVDALLYLAKLYKEDGEMIKYENLLLSVIGMSFATSEQNAESYEKLLTIYENAGDYVSMADILLGCNNVEVKEKYIDYCIMTPEFNLDSGYYGTDQLFKITIPGRGRIFYTLDGTDPDLYSSEYSVPLLLTKGEYDFRVCVLNPYGIWSAVTECSIVIESEELYEAIEPYGDRKEEEHEIIDYGFGVYTVDGIPCVVGETGEFVTVGKNIDGIPYVETPEGELIPLIMPDTTLQAEGEAVTPEEGEVMQEESGISEEADSTLTENTDTDNT